MPLPVSLKKVAEEMELIPDDGWYSYINRKTGEMIGFSEEEADMAYYSTDDMPPWFVERAPDVRRVLEDDAFIELPGQFERDDYSTMQEFSNSRPEPEAEVLLRAIKGKGAFRRFGDTIIELGIREDWFAWKFEAVKEVAREFLEDEEIPYTEE